MANSEEKHTVFTFVITEASTTDSLKRLAELEKFAEGNHQEEFLTVGEWHACNEIITSRRRVLIRRLIRQAVRSWWWSQK